MKHNWEWTGERCTKHSSRTKPHGSFEFICKGCGCTVWASGPPMPNSDGRSQILQGLTDHQTTIEADCSDQMASNIIEEGWRIV